MMSVAGVTSGAIQAPSATPGASGSASLFGEIWDTINPLQHIPLVSSLYRTVTDTSISTFSNIAGSTLYGGPIGGAIAAVQEGASAIFGSNKSSTQTATAAPVANVQTAGIEPAAGTKAVGAQHHRKMHSSTMDWLYQNLTDDAQSTDSATNITSEKATSTYQKIQSSTADWLSHPSQYEQSQATATGKTV